MKKLLNHLLKDTYTKKDLAEQLRLITTDAKATNFRSSEGKPYLDEETLITPDIIEKLPLVIITLAVSLTKEEIRRLGQWFRQNIDPQILLDLRRDAKILGGCQLIWQGMEGDFSLKRKFQEGKNGS